MFEREYIYNWPNILYNIEHNLFTREEAHEWFEASGSWITCACGNLCDAIERDPKTGAPADLELGTLGREFHRYIARTLEERNHYARRRLVALSRTTLTSIEGRAEELLAQVS